MFQIFSDERQKHLSSYNTLWIVHFKRAADLNCFLGCIYFLIRNSCAWLPGRNGLSSTWNQGIKRQDPDYDEQFLPGGWVPYQSIQGACLVGAQCCRGGQIRNTPTIDVINSQVCVGAGLAEYPLLVPALDIDPFFIVLNEVTVAMRAKADLIGAGIGMEPSQVESLETYITSSQGQLERIERPTVLWLLTTILSTLTAF